MTTDTTPAAGPAVRSDLLALTPDTLAALTNRGLVKRATKELAAGTGPTVTTAPDGTVHACHPDGSATSLPPGTGLDNGACSCAAPGVCRHLVALVLAYRSAVPAAASEASPGPAPRAEQETGTPSPAPPAVPAPEVAWSPGSVGEEELHAALGAPALASARRVFERGYGARVHRPTAERPDPWVELPTCTVRFPVAGELVYALTDASAGRRDEMVALAVWAFRAADEAGPHEAAVHVGGRAAPKATARDELDAVAALADELLLSGVAHAGPVLAVALARAGETLSAKSLHWPAGAVGELADQLSAYADRSAHYRPERVAALLTEIHARRRAAALPGVLGTQEAGTTPLRRVRLTSLGCRVRTTPTGSAAEVCIAHPGAATVLVLRKEWPTAEGQEADRTTGHRLSTRRLLGTTLGKLATGNLVSESARRTAGRVLTIAGNRLGATSVTPVGLAWTELPDPLLVRDLAALTAGWEGRPPRLIRPRIEAGSVRVLALSEVEHVGYDPAEQLLEASVRDEAGNRALVRSRYRPECPGALDVLADALESGATHLSGSVRRSGGSVRIEPIAVLGPKGVIVPDLAPGGGSAPLEAVVRQSADPLTAALDEAIGALASVAHSGLRNPADQVRARLDDAATALSRTGLSRAAALLRAVGHGGEDNADRTGAWLEAQLHVLVGSELRALESP